MVIDNSIESKLRFCKFNHIDPPVFADRNAVMSVDLQIHGRNSALMKWR